MFSAGPDIQNQLCNVFYELRDTASLWHLFCNAKSTVDNIEVKRVVAFASGVQGGLTRTTWTKEFVANKVVEHQDPRHPVDKWTKVKADVCVNLCFMTLSFYKSKCQIQGALSGFENDRVLDILKAYGKHCAGNLVITGGPKLALAVFSGNTGMPVSRLAVPTLQRVCSNPHFPTPNTQTAAEDLVIRMMGTVVKLKSSGTLTVTYTKQVEHEIGTLWAHAADASSRLTAYVCDSIHRGVLCRNLGASKVVTANRFRKLPTLHGKRYSGYTSREVERLHGPISLSGRKWKRKSKKLYMYLNLVGMVVNINDFTY